MLEQCQIIPIEAVPHARGCVFAPARVRLRVGVVFRIDKDLCVANSPERLCKMTRKNSSL